MNEDREREFEQAHQEHLGHIQLKEHYEQIVQNLYATLSKEHPEFKHYIIKELHNLSTQDIKKFKNEFKK